MSAGQRLAIRDAAASDRAALRRAVIALQEHERALSGTRLPGESIADAYLDYLARKTVPPGACLVAEIEGVFAGFAAGWVVEGEWLAETADSRRHGLVSDICVLPEFRGRRIATALLAALEARLRAASVNRVRLGVLSANVSARAAYERAGYTAYEVIYEKQLDAKSDRL